MVIKTKERTFEAFTILIFLILISGVSIAVAIFGGQVVETALGGQVADFTYVYTDVGVARSSALTSGALSLTVNPVNNSCFSNLEACNINLNFNSKNHQIKIGEKIDLDEFISIKLDRARFSRTASQSICPNNNFKFSDSGVNQGCAVEETIIPGDLKEYGLEFLVYVNTENFISTQFQQQQNIVKWLSEFSDAARLQNNYNKRLNGEINLNVESVSLFQGVTDERLKVDLPVGDSGSVNIKIPTENPDEIVKVSIKPIVIFSYITHAKQQIIGEAISTETDYKLFQIKPQILGEEFITFDQKLVDRTASEASEILPSLKEASLNLDDILPETANAVTTETSKKSPVALIFTIIGVLIVFIIIYIIIILRLKRTQ